MSVAETAVFGKSGFRTSLRFEDVAIEFGDRLTFDIDH
jgi:hypothetical protein